MKFDFKVKDSGSGVEYTPWTDGYAIGYKIAHPNGDTTYIYLNPSQSEGEGDGNVFVYTGDKGNPEADLPWHHYNIEAENK